MTNCVRELRLSLSGIYVFAVRSGWLSALSNQYGVKAAVDALELAIKNNSVNKADATILAARITGYGIDTPPEPGPSLKIYDQTFLPAKGEAGKGVVA